MMTQTHLLVGAACLSRRETPVRNIAVFAGALLPDAAMFVFFGYEMAQQRSQSDIWNVQYWQPGWQASFAVFNSLPLYALLLGAGVALQGRRDAALNSAIIAFALAALLHICADFPVHADDAHQHFWPVSNWRFYSPVSYWDGDHHALWVGALEAGIGITCAVFLMRRFASLWAKAACLTACCPYVIGLLWAFTGSN